ncbi:8550_t:CDS:2, partial [Entrophospora sp. SA101]
MESCPKDVGFHLHVDLMQHLEVMYYVLIIQIFHKFPLEHPIFERSVKGLVTLKEVYGVQQLENKDYPKLYKIYQQTIEELKPGLIFCEALFNLACFDVAYQLNIPMVSFNTDFMVVNLPYISDPMIECKIYMENESFWNRFKCEILKPLRLYYTFYSHSNDLINTEYNWVPQPSSPLYLDISFTEAIDKKMIDVPVLSLPLAFDQYGNAERLEFLNVGLTLNKLSFNVPEVIEKLERLLNDKNIEKNEDDKYIDGLMREWITPDTRMGFFKGNYYDVY